MALNSFDQWLTAAASNTDVGGTPLGENLLLPSNINNAFREMMAQLATALQGGTTIVFTSTDAGATAAPIIRLYRNSATPAASDFIGKLQFDFEDSAGNTEEGGSVAMQVVDATSASEDTRMLLRTKVAGALVDTLALENSTATLLSTDAGAAAGPILDFYRNSATPAVADALGNITFSGEDDAGNKVAYATIGTSILNTSSLGPSSSFGIHILASGAAGGFTISGSQFVPDTDNQTALGSTALRWADLFLAEGGVINWDNGDVTLTQSGNSLTVAGGNFIAPGTATNDSASAGQIGEEMVATVASGSAAALTSNTPLTIAQLDLTAGDWDVRGLVAFTPAATTSVTQVSGCLSTVTNANQFTNARFCRNIFGAVVAGANTPAFTCPIPSNRISLAAPTTIYLVAYAIFTVDTLSAWGQISARRVR